MFVGGVVHPLVRWFLGGTFRPRTNENPSRWKYVKLGDGEEIREEGAR